MNDEFEFYGGLFFGSIIGAAFLAVILGMCSVWSAYQNGYCAALGGTTLTQTVCNVDGKVVEIP
jgi:hypothetical protein